jgi:hypothetical protein
MLLLELLVADQSVASSSNFNIILSLIFQLVIQQLRRSISHEWHQYIGWMI